jgi:hypothetical protein
MEGLGPKIDEVEQLESLDPTALDALERLRIVLTLCGKRLGGTDPLTIPPVPLDAIAGSLDSARAEIEAYVTDRSAPHLFNANHSADAALIQLAQVPTVATKQELVGLVQAVNDSRKVFERHANLSSDSLKKATSEIDGLRGNLDAFTAQTQTAVATMQAQLDAERQKISTQASEQHKLFADAQELRSNTYTESLRKTQESLSQTLTDQQRQFSDAQENRSREFASAQTDAQKRLNDVVIDYTKKLSDQDAEFTKARNLASETYMTDLGKLITEYEKGAKKILEDVDRHRVDVEKLVGMIGSLGVTSGYQRTANIARRSMWIWQGVAVLALVAVIWFAYHAFLPTMQGDFRWGAFATRVFLTITVGVLAAYAVSQADRFFHMEIKNRKLALELAAIDPFIALLPSDEQFKFKLEVGRRTFAQDESPNAVKPEKSPATTLDVIASKEGQSLLQLILDVVKAVKKSD